MTKRNHPITAIKFNPKKEHMIELLGRDTYYQHERQDVVDSTAEMTIEWLECFNMYFTEQIVQGITEGFNRTHRQIQSDALNGIVKVFGELAKNLDTGCFDLRNEYALKMMRNMFLAATNHHVIDYIESLKCKSQP